MNPWVPLLILAVAALVGGVLGAWWLWRTKIKRTYLFSFGTMILPAPGRITLQRLAKSDPLANGRVEKRAEAFRELGFENIATYSLSELSGAKLHVLSQPASGLVALVHEHSCVGTWSDVMRFSSAAEPPILASNILKYAHFQCLPGDPKWHHPDASEAELVRVLQSMRTHTGAAQTIDAQSFPRLCERAYAEAADERFRNLPTENEIRRLIKDVSPEAELSDADIAALHRLLPEWIANDQRVSCLRDFVNEGGISAREWQQARERILVVHDHTRLPSLNSRLICGAFRTEELKRRLKKARAHSTPREEFAELNAALPASERYKKIGSVHKPVPADIYRAPLPGGVS